MPQDLADAVCQQLRASPCAELFGDTWDASQTTPGVMKFFTDWAGDSAAPWLVVEEVGETYEFQTAGDGNYRPYIATGQTLVRIYAADRAQARALGIQVAIVLDDPAMAWVGFPDLMSFRLLSAAFLPQIEPGPSVPTIFRRVLTFQHQYSGFLGLFS